MMRPKNIASIDWLSKNVTHPNMVLVDCRFELGKPEKGHESYQEEHIPGALYFDLEKDLSGPKEKHGGRHPLPNLELFAQKLGEAGINASKKVVAYDDQGGMVASRLWWMLKYLGHEEVVILREGFSSWKERGFPTTNEIKKNKATQFESHIQPDMLVGVEDVKGQLTDDNVILIDARAKERYLGLVEDLDPKAGHIPNAVNEFWKEGLGPDGGWKTPQEQKVRLAHYLQRSEKEIIIYCGSGVTACANVIAFDEVGLRPKLYIGSWSDWISYPDNKVE